MRIDLHVEGQLPGFGFVPERPRDGIDQVREENLLRVDGDRAGFDLRQIENVADEVQQIGARTLDGARELDLLRRKVALGIVGELLAQNENAVERRAQLMRHVGKELGFVFGRERKFACLFLERPPGLLDFLVLALHFNVALGELLGLLLELIVGLLQLSLLRLQLAGKLLGLLEEPLGLHRGFD